MINKHQRMNNIHIYCYICISINSDGYEVYQNNYFDAAS